MTSAPIHYVTKHINSETHSWTASLASFAIFSLGGSTRFIIRAMLATGRNRSCLLAKYIYWKILYFKHCEWLPSFNTTRLSETSRRLLRSTKLIHGDSIGFVVTPKLGGANRTEASCSDFRHGRIWLSRKEWRRAAPVPPAYRSGRSNRLVRTPRSAPGAAYCSRGC